MSNVTRSKDDLWLFVPDFFDDYGLSSDEYRIYARISRRAGKDGECWESVAGIAEGCFLSRRKAAYCLRILELAGLITGTPRKHESTVYKLNPYSKWVHPDQLKAIRESVITGKTERKPKHKKDTAQDAVLHDMQGGTACDAGGTAQDADKIKSIKLIPRLTNQSELDDSTRLEGEGVAREATHAECNPPASTRTPSETEEKKNNLNDESKSSDIALNDAAIAVIERLKELQPPNDQGKKVIFPDLQKLITDHPEAALSVYQSLFDAGKLFGKNPAGYYKRCLEQFLGINQDRNRKKKSLDDLYVVPEPSEELPPFKENIHKDGEFAKVPKALLKKLSQNDADIICVIGNSTGFHFTYKGGMGEGYLEAMVRDHKDWNVYLPPNVITGYMQHLKQSQPQPNP